MKIVGQMINRWMINFMALRIVSVYFIFSLMWILFSDALLAYMVVDIELLNTLQSYKGAFFVAITSIMLFLLIHSHLLKTSRIEKKLEENEQRLKYVIQGANLGYWDWDYQNNHHIVNDTWLDFLGLKREDIKNDVTDWSGLIHPADKIVVQQAIEQTLIDFKPYVVEFRMRHANGNWVWIEGSGAVVQKNEQTGEILRLAGTHRDITQRKTAEEEIVFLAMHDALTKLPNRILLKRKLDLLVSQVTKPTQCAFVFLDLDAFKNINDLYGHSVGDKIIQDVASRLLQKLNIEDTIARVGGDEFVIITQKTDTVEAMCQEILEVLNEPFALGDENIAIGASIGIALYPQNGSTFEELFKNADIAMYAAKNSGKNRYKFYQHTMSEQLYETATLDNAIKKAIENDEFILHYQPQINLQTGAVTGLEVLVRWENPIKGMIFPNEFIHRAEENGLMVPLGTLILKKALIQRKKWQETGAFTGVMAINISGAQIEEDGFVALLESLLEEVGVDAHHIELEITESVLMRHAEQSIETLQKLKNLGFCISIDDFGTGYSSLSNLKKLPIDKLKIDRSFIMDLPDDHEDRAISKIIIDLAKTLELEVIAEGVETEAQHQFLLENGCDSAQGYLFTKPVCSEKFIKFCKKT